MFRLILNIEYCLLRGFIEYITHQKIMATEYLNIAISMLEEVTRFSQNEKLYLIAYAKSMLKEYDTNYEHQNLSDINLSNVSVRLKDLFPLIEHPQWKNS